MSGGDCAGDRVDKAKVAAERARGPRTLPAFVIDLVIDLRERHADATASNLAEAIQIPLGTLHQMLYGSEV
jgi:Trm5-related predicted tRNA methylase